MLQRLYISNYALIDSVDIRYESGLSTITGETGAGKSILLGALSLVLGKRADTQVLKDKNQKAIIEIELTLSASNTGIRTIFESYDVDFDTHTTIRREISPQGKSRAFINDTPTNLQALKDIGESLIDIHSQHENLLLKDSNFQTEVIDAAAQNKAIRDAYGQAYTEWEHAKLQLKKYNEKIETHKKELHFIEFKLAELQTANLQADELELLEEESKILEQGEEILKTIEQCNAFFNEEHNTLSALKNITNEFQKKEKLSKTFSDFHSRFQQVFIDLTELARDIDSFSGNFEFDIDTLNGMHERINFLQSLLSKYNKSSIAELIEEKEALETILSEIEAAQFDNKTLENACKEKEKQVIKIAAELRNSRQKAITHIQPQLIAMLQSLGMPSVNFEIELKDFPQLSNLGSEAIEMKFSANKHISASYLGNISSGGELSRVMLCLKAIVSKENLLQTIIFDEIDTGVSGEIADKMGEIMLDIAAHIQVIVITHLPQIAAKAKKHYKVFKIETTNTTITNIETLSEKQRIEEIAKMMSGAVITDAALDNAKHLLGIHL